ncbi:MAG: protein-arginine kinase [Kiritimatiellia bacterium]|jgi:protein-arginine kinase
MLARHMTPALREELADLRSALGASLADITRSGDKHPDSSIGVYAPDADSYQVFAPLLDGIIEEYHGRLLDTVPRPDLSALPASAAFSDDRIVSTRIRVARNLAGVAFGGNQDRASRVAVADRIADVLAELPEEHRGVYRHLGDIAEAEQVTMRAEHRLFQQGDRFLEAAGLNRDWPAGRAVFESADGVAMVWVGEEDHLRIMALQAGGDLPAVFSRMGALATTLGQTLPFAWDARRGYLTSCPTNLGTGLRASVHVCLVGLGRDPDALHARARELNLQVRGTHGEHTESEGGVYDVSNSQRLGLTERAAVMVLANGLRVLLSEDTAAL